MTFEDETEQVANDNFKLYKMIYARMPPSIPGKQIDKMKRTYVGKKFTLMAYETGHFPECQKTILNTSQAEQAELFILKTIW